MDVEEWLTTANTYWQQGQINEAMQCYLRVVELQPRHTQALLFLGILQYKAGQYDLANSYFLQVMEFKPNCAEAYFYMGLSLQKKQELAGALECFSYAIRFKPDFAEAYCNAGVVMQKLGQLAKAEKYFQQASTLQPDNEEICYNLGSVFHQREKYGEAESLFRRAVQLRPEYAEAQFALAVSLLTRKIYKEGFDRFEWRKRLHGVESYFSLLSRWSEWQGESFEGKTVLVYSEQGYGDTIQFVRYLPLVKKRGGRVVLMVQPELIRLFRDIDGIDELRAFSPACLEAVNCDLAISIMSIPQLFFRESEGIFNSQTYYLHPQEELLGVWKKRIGTKTERKRIGLVWAGSPTNMADRRRSVPLKELQPLLDLQEFDWYSLQVGQGKLQLGELKDCSLFDLTDDIQDFADTAALIVHMDLVICVDTVVAHLAAALGIPVWLLLGQSPDWRWGVLDADSPWYPGVQIFRQGSRGSWKELVARVKENLLRVV